MALGPELITNGSFNGNDDNWVSAGDWIYDTNKELFIGSGSPGESLSQSIDVSNGTFYVIGFTMTSGSGSTGTLRMRIGDGQLFPIYIPPDGVTEITTFVKANISTIPDAQVIEFQGRNTLDALTITDISAKSIAVSDLSLGPELITNGGFIGSASGWTLGTGWAYSSNNVQHTAGNNNEISQIISTGDEELYLVTVTVGGTVGVISTQIGTGPSTDGVDAGTGTIQFIVQQRPTFGDSTFRLYPSTDFDGTVTDISVKKILGLLPDGNLYLQNTQMVGSDTAGDIQTMNAGKDDDGTPIYYELETQGLEFGNVFHRKKISDKIVVFTKDGIDSALQGKTDDNDYQNVEIDLSNRVNIGQSIKLEGNTTTFKWFGEAGESSPILEGFYLEKVEDLGITKG